MALLLLPTSASSAATPAQGGWGETEGGREGGRKGGAPSHMARSKPDAARRCGGYQAAAASGERRASGAHWHGGVGHARTVDLLKALLSLRLDWRAEILRHLEGARTHVISSVLRRVLVQF